MSRVELIGVSKSYGSTIALHGADLQINEGEFMTLLGPSGCGKTTTLRLVAGFIDPTSGTIRLGSADVTRLPPHRREIGMVFQDYALFPHMNVADNISFGLKERKVSGAASEKRVQELLELIRLPHIAKRYPSELSGGQAQRVAFARAIAHPPRVLLMDEPLGALDLKLREDMQLELRRLQQALGITTIFVTHDQGEAMSMSDRITVMNSGRIEQIGSAESIYGAPASRFVASFVGQINLIECTTVEMDAAYTVLRTGRGKVVRARTNRQIGNATKCTLAIRPEKLRVRSGSDTSSTLNAMTGRVTTRSFLGSTLKLVVDTGEERPLLIEDKPEVVTALVGDTVEVEWSPDDTQLLDR